MIRLEMKFKECIGYCGAREVEWYDIDNKEVSGGRYIEGGREQRAFRFDLSKIDSITADGVVVYQAVSELSPERRKFQEILEQAFR